MIVNTAPITRLSTEQCNPQGIWNLAQSATGAAPVTTSVDSSA